MPIPKPTASESQNDYMGRCMHFLAHESGTDRTNDQMVAICMQTWRDRGKAKQMDPEDMAPDPDPGESQGDYMDRCMSAVSNSDSEMSDTECEECCATAWANRSKAARTPERKALPLEIKSLGTREFEGYASVFHNVDLGGDIVQPGAFRKSLKAHSASGTLPQMFWMHDPSRIPGKWVAMEEDKHGLYCKGVLAATPLGDEMRTLLQMDAVRGLSIGYMIEDDSFDKAGNRLLKQVDLWETSLVSMAMNPLARVTGSKSQLSSAGEYVPTPRELEQFFRLKCSRKVARLMVAKVFADGSSSGTLEEAASKLFGALDAASATPAGSRWDADNSEVARALSNLRDTVIADSFPKIF